REAKNVQRWVMEGEGGKVMDDGRSRGYYAPYASRVRRIDACFGHFVKFLKDHGLYETSIVVFTADHGDSLGEQGRWGHAYALVPGIVPIPPIVHLPPPSPPPPPPSTPPPFST